MIHNLDSVEVSEIDRKTLRSLRNERLIVLSNHPTTKEPPVIYSLANIMSSRFHYMASREVFEWGSGMVGDYIQSIGAYSVIAGANDKESLKATRAILSSPSGKLAVFPEGEPTSGQNDILLPFQPGIAQLGFWGLEDALKKDPNANIQILPSFIKYRMSLPQDELQKDIDTSLENLENRIGITKLGKTVTERFLSIGRRLLEREEREYGITLEEGKDYNYRLGRLRHTILDNIANKIELSKYDTSENAIVKLRKILSFLELASLSMDTGKDPAPSKDVVKWAKVAAEKAYDSITLQVDYLLDHPSAERLYEWLYRFESEILGETKNRPHLARVRLGEPISLIKYYSAYKQNKKETVQSITDHLRDVLERLMEEEIIKTNILFPAGHKF